MPVNNFQLEPVLVGEVLLKPSKHLQSLAKDGDAVFKVDDEGFPEVWLGARLWEVSGRGIAKAGEVVDPGAPGPVVRVMTLEDQAYIVAWLSRPGVATQH